MIVGGERLFRGSERHDMGWWSGLFGRKAAERKAAPAEPFPEAWLRLTRRVVAPYPALDAQQQSRLQRCIQEFVATKRFTGLDGLEITDHIRVEIAAPACLLIVGMPEEHVFPRVHEIIVRPHAFGKVTEAVGPGGRHYQIPEMHSGEAWRRGPIILAWDNVRMSIAHPCDGFNVLYHEFAHALDMENAAIALLTTAEQHEWRRVFDAAYQAFVAANAQGQPTFLNPYGAKNPAEFFAVITEHFFEQPRPMRQVHSKLYEQLTRIYRLDPASWHVR